MARCDACGMEFEQNHGRGRKARFCSTRCRMRAHRSQLPPVMANTPRWAAADGKRPIQRDGRPASSTSPATWATLDRVRHMPHGFMLGGGFGCYDLDHVTDAEARRFAKSVPEPIIFTERSLSGEGVHIFVEAPESKGWMRVVDGISVERYTQARFIRMTGTHVKL